MKTVFGICVIFASVCPKMYTQLDNSANEVLTGLYTECVLGLSFICLQKKLITFLSKLDKIKKLELVGDQIAVVRKDDLPSETETLAKISHYVDQNYLKDIIDQIVENFFDTHLVRVKIPHYFGEIENELFLNLDFGDARTTVAVREGRSKPKIKKKGLKKFIFLMGLLMILKLTMMGPLMIAMIGLKAMKALIFGVMSLTISKMMLLSKVNFSGLMKGHSSHGGGGGHGGGWDRDIQEPLPTPASYQPYNEPPVPYNSYSIPPYNYN